ncbi:NUDIX domain-containing protein [Candidatus Woesebacteria bacterium]|nr:NUDIX domain-containing protein [Candidatus Woesebacteria bacterium]
MNIPASYLVLMNERGQVLLLRRFNTGFKDGMYSLVAGHVDAGETFTQALVREVREEAGIVVLPEDAEVVHLMHRKSDTDGSERTDVFFVVRKWSGEITNCEPGKCDELSWFDMDNLPENMVEYIRVALGHIWDGVRYSEVGW